MRIVVATLALAATFGIAVAGLTVTAPAASAQGCAGPGGACPPN